MKVLFRNDTEEGVLKFVMPNGVYDTDDIVFKYKKNTEDDWNTGTVNSFSSECCAYVLVINVDTTDISSGSYFVKIEDNGLQSAIEEIVLMDEVEDVVVSNYEGVKITNG